MSGRTGAWLSAIRRLAMVAALLALLTGLGNRPEPAARHRPQLDVLLAVDRTTSMSAVDDPTGSRITAARRDLLALLDDLGAVDVAVSTFGRDAQLELPLTSDRTAIADAVRALQVEPATVGSGSSLDRAVSLLVDQLDQIDELDQATPDSEHRTVVIVVSDGEATTATDVRPFAEVGERVQAAVVLGYGTAEGGVMPVRRLDVDGGNAREVAAGPLVPDPLTAAPAVSRLDPGTLQQVADQLGGTYVHPDGSQDLADTAAALSAAAYADLSPTEPRRELRWVWALLLLLLTVPELLTSWRGFLEARRASRS
jgi:Ca-activated chloride channel family protein